MSPRIVWSRRIGRALVFFAIASNLAVAQSEPPKPAAEQFPTEAKIRETIERSLPWIAKEGERWMEAKKCDSCHQVPFMVWSLNTAANHGFKIDRSRLEEWNKWARDWKSIRGRDQAKEGEEVKTLTNSPDELAQLLLGAPVKSTNPLASDEVAWRMSFRSYLLQAQLEDGSWKPGGQLPGQKRPWRETQEVTTLWSLLALKCSQELKSSEQPAMDKAVKWIGKETRGESTEWWSVRLLWEHALGDAKATQSLREELLKRQRPDGGWGWLCSEESDSLATGQALYALCRTGMAKDELAVRRAQQFLYNSQSEQGSWSVKGTKSNKKDRVEATASYWGTCWATIGLSESLSPFPE